MTQIQPIPARSEKYRYHRECETTSINTIPTATDVENFSLSASKEVDEEYTSTEAESIRWKVNESVNEIELMLAI